MPPQTTGDIRVDEIMPELDQAWARLPFEECLLPNKSNYRKLKQNELQRTGLIPVIDQGEDFIAGYTDEAENQYRGSLPVVIFGDHTRRLKYVDFKFAVGADGVKLLHPGAALDAKFFYYYLRTLKLDSQGYSRHYRFLKEIDVPLPPLNEQRHIVAKLEKLLSRVEAAQARLATIPRILKQFRQSILAAACSGRLTADWRKEPKVRETAAILLASVRSQRRERWSQAEMAKQSSNGKRSSGGKRADKYPDPRKIVDDDLSDLPEEWVWASLDEVSYRLTYGITVRPQYVEDGVSMISAREIRYGEVDLLKANRISRSDYDDLREKCRIYFGDVLFSKTGTIGSVARVKTAEPLCSSQNIAVISPLIESAFLETVLRSSIFQQRAQGAVKNTAVSDLQLGVMARFPIPIPPLSEQQEIVRRVDALCKTADALEARYHKAKAQVDKLTQSILAKAFRGELVPQDRNDEPAAELLERIRKIRL